MSERHTGPAKRSLAPTPLRGSAAARRGTRGRPTAESSLGHVVPDATIARLPVYLRALTTLAESGHATVSSEQLASVSGVNSAKVRKDLSHLGSYGTRGVGYDVDVLAAQISRELGLTQHRGVVLVGVGNLGHALAGYAGFASRGFRIAGLLDADPRRIGEVVHGMPVRPVDALADTVDETGASIGVIATPADAAQEVCDQLVAAGITSILNFAPVHLDVPDGVDLRKVDLAVELQILSFHEARKDARRARHVRSGEADASQHDATRDARDAPGPRRAADLHPEPDFHPEPEFDPAFEPAEELA